MVHVGSRLLDLALVLSVLGGKFRSLGLSGGLYRVRVRV